MSERMREKRDWKRGEESWFKRAGALKKQRQNEIDMLVMVSGDISWMTGFTRELELVKPLEIIFPKKSSA